MELVEKYGFIEMILEKLQQFELTKTTYNALFEVYSIMSIVLSSFSMLHISSFDGTVIHKLIAI